MHEAVQKFTVGLTGGIGSGKSLVATLFQEHGVPIIDADESARAVVTPNMPALKEIQHHFGEEFILAGKINRPLLRQYIFDHPAEKRWLENLLHPLIRQHMLQQINAIDAPYCLLVIPLLIENLPHPLVQRILLVDTTEDLQVQRTMARDNLDRAAVEKILQAQVDRATRLQKADDVILNNGDVDSLKQQVSQLHEYYLSIACLRNSLDPRFREDDSPL